MGSKFKSTIACCLVLFFSISVMAAQTGVYRALTGTAAKISTINPQTLSGPSGVLTNYTSNQVAQYASTGSPCATVPDLTFLSNLNDTKKSVGIAFKDAIHPVFVRFKDLSQAELETLRANDPNVFEKSFPPDADQKFDAFLTELVNFEKGAERTLASTIPVNCSATVNNKAGRLLAALLLQQWLDGSATPLLRTLTQKVAKEYDDNYVVADQVVYNAMKAGIEFQFATTPAEKEAYLSDYLNALHQLQFYLAGAGDFDFPLFEFALAYGTEVVLAKLDGKGLGPMKEDFLGDVAPIFLLVADVGSVGRGMKSPSAYLLHRHKEAIKAGIQKNGWPGGVMTAWNRKAGKPADFVVGPSSGKNCVTADPMAWAESNDLGTINFGDCGTAERLASCPMSLGGKSIYPNLCKLCAEPTAALGNPGAPGSAQSAYRKLGGNPTTPGPTLNNVGALCNQIENNGSDMGNDLQCEAMPDPICNIQHETQKVCGPSRQNPGGALGVNKSDSSGCDDEPEVGAPTGDNCMPGNKSVAQGGGGLSEKTIKAALDAKANGLVNAKDPIKEVFKRLGQGMGQTIKVGHIANITKLSGGKIILKTLLFGTVGTVVGILFEPSALACSTMDCQPKTNQPPQGGGSRDPSLEPDKLPKPSGSSNTPRTGTVTVEILTDYDGDGIDDWDDDSDGDGVMDDQDAEPENPAIQKSEPEPTDTSTKGASGDHPDEFSPSECTWYGQVLKEAGACMEQTVAQGTQALGMPNKSVPPSRPLDPVSKIAPDAGEKIGSAPAEDELCTLPGGPTTLGGVIQSIGKGGLTNPAPGKEGTNADKGFVMDKNCMALQRCVEGQPCPACAASPNSSPPMPSGGGTGPQPLPYTNSPLAPKSPVPKTPGGLP